MARVKKTEEEHKKFLADALVDWSASKAKPRKKRDVVASITFERASAQARAMVGAGVWKGARPIDFVALYSLLHSEVYGVEPADLNATTRLRAAQMAGGVLRRHFRGEPEEMADYMHWVWKRERQDEVKRRAGVKGGSFRITWRYQFGDKLVADYFVGRSQLAHRATTQNRREA